MKSLSTVSTVQLRYSNNVYHQAEDAEPGLGEENIMIGTQQCRWGERPNLGTKWQKWCKNQSINACLSDTPMIMLCDRTAGTPVCAAALPLKPGTRPRTGTPVWSRERERVIGAASSVISR